MKATEIFETIRISFDSLRGNLLRSFLASLGVLIGISFVIIMGWLLSGLDNVMQETFNIIGTDMLYVDKWDWAGGKSWRDVRNRKNITLEQVEEFCESIESAEFAIPNGNNWSGSVKYKGDAFNGITIVGTSYLQSSTPAGEVSEGRYISPFEDDQGSNVVVLGFNVNKQMFPDENAIGKEIKLDGIKYRVIGVVTKRGTIMFDMIDNQIFIPFKSFVSNFGHRHRSLSIAVKAGSVENLAAVRDESIGLMRTIRNLKPGEEDDFSINETKAFEDMVEKFRLYLWAIGIGMTVLSFLVGMIGIMNIMFVSVTDRTKEIGIRKAIGAKSNSILLQFITEAAALCFIGALLALIVCSVFVFAVATWLPAMFPYLSFLSPVLPFRLLLIASFVSVFVGVLAGLIPAFRAARLDPVEAIRAE